jgi:hypothetical protein
MLDVLADIGVVLPATVTPEVAEPAAAKFA